MITAARALVVTAAAIALIAWGVSTFLAHALTFQIGGGFR